MQKVTIIGAGNIGVAIARGLSESGLLSKENITLTRRRVHLLDNLRTEGFSVCENNISAIGESDVVLISVEPQQVDKLLNEISGAIASQNPLIISVVTGVGVSKLRALLGDRIRIIRAMPNTAISVRESMTCIVTDSASKNDIETAVSLFESVGTVLQISETQMNAATALGACGIAFFLQAIRAASQGGIEIGFNAAEALAIASQTAKGAAELILKLRSHPSEEIDKVTTPKGCTISGLNQLEHEGFSSALIKGIKTSEEKAALLYPNSGDDIAE